MVFHRSLSDSKSLQASRTLLSILAVLNNAVVWMVYTRPPTSKSSSPFNNPFVTIPKSPITIGITVTLLFHSFVLFFQFSGRVEVLTLLFPFFQLYTVISRYRKVHNFASAFFLLITIRFDLLAEIRWPVCMSKTHRSLSVLFSKTDAGLCIYHLLVWSNFNSLHNSQLITLSTQLCLVLYFFCANLLITWLLLLILLLSEPAHTRLSQTRELKSKYSTRLLTAVVTCKKRRYRGCRSLTGTRGPRGGKTKINNGKPNNIKQSDRQEQQKSTVIIH